MARLKRWDVEGPIPDDLYREIVSHPRFATAVRLLADNMLAVAAADRALDGIFKDSGRYLAAMWALYLHETVGLTLPALKATCASSGWLSPGRARALLLYLRHLGFIETTAERRAGGPILYAPTETFLSAWRRQLEAALAAAAVLEPAVRCVLGALSSPTVLATYSRLHAEGLLAPAQAADQGSAFLRVFMHRHAGNQIAWILIAAGGADAFPAQGPVSLPVAATARRFGVSPIHVRRLIEDGEREGLLKHPPGGVVFLEEAARAAIRAIYAAQLIQLLAASARTLAACPELEVPERRLA